MKKWIEFYKYQQANVCSYDNQLDGGFESGVGNIDNLQFALKDVEILWLIMYDGYYFGDYEEGATEIGITKDGKWAVLEDSHCSCYGWEAHEGDITFYDSLDVLLKAEPEAKVLMNYKAELIKCFPFITKALERK